MSSRLTRHGSVRRTILPTTTSIRRSPESRLAVPTTTIERHGEPPIGGLGRWIVLRDGDAARVTQWSLFENGDAQFGTDPRTSLAASIARATRDGLETLD